MIIGVSGAQGSFSEEAGRTYRHAEGVSEQDIKLSYLVGVEQVLTALDVGAIDRGVFPIENSNGGIVYEAVYAMSQHMFSIEKIFEIDIRHCLMAVPGTKVSDITAIASHDQALKQCRMYLKRVWKDVELVEYEDTAKAAHDLSQKIIPEHTAVIAPRRSAELYGLDILEEGVQDLKFNFTTFIVAEKQG